MAGLISTGIWGYICSCLPTGKRDNDGKPIYKEHFLSGFAGWGWKIWKTVAGFFRLEIDELVVRRTMTVFELLIQKIRAIKGALAITQGNGKIKSAVLSDDGTAYLITLEEDDMSLMEYDFIRCQEFTAVQRFYHVEIESVSEGVIRVPVSEFADSSLPSPGDEIVQFGNSSHDAKYAGRHSAIYMHADESGQPAIDVLFDIYSKDWTGCLNVRAGGDIPQGDGAKGFYCKNGMILSVDDNDSVVYKFSPNGGFSLGRGKIVYDPVLDKISLSGITISWDDIENAPDIEGGEPGKDGRYMTYQYAINTNPSVAPTTGWTGTIPAVGEGQYMWERRGLVIPPATEPGTWSAGIRVTGATGNPGADAVVYSMEFEQSGAIVNSIQALSDGTPKNASNVTAKLYQTTGSIKTPLEAGYWMVEYYLGAEEINYLDTDVPGSSLEISLVTGIVYDSIRVYAASGEGFDKISHKATIAKVLDGATGSLEELPDWLKGWNGYATELGAEYIVTPKMFSGTKRTDENGVELLTGIAQGKECITIGGVKRTGIFALVDNEVVFELDPITKKYLFRGRVEADEGLFSGSLSTPFIEVIDESNIIFLNDNYNLMLTPKSSNIGSIAPGTGIENNGKLLQIYNKSGLSVRLSSNSFGLPSTTIALLQDGKFMQAIALPDENFTRVTWRSFASRSDI